MNIQSTAQPDIRVPFNEWQEKIIRGKKENPPLAGEGHINNTKSNQDGHKCKHS